MPFEGLNEKNEHIGMSSDYYNLFEKMLSAKFELVKTENWNESINFIKENKCDMLALGMETPERKEYLNFTSSYLEVPLVVATKIEVPFINHILDLEGEKIGIIKGDAFVKILRQKYPSLNIIEVDDINEGLDKVKNGQLFAFIDTLASIGYEFQKNYFGELKIAGKISENLKLSIAVVKEDKILLNILQKTVNKITNEMHRRIFNKWLPIKYQKGIDYDLALKISIAAIFLIILIIYWNRKIIKANDLLKIAKKDIEEKNKLLEKLSITDDLTKIYNRRKLDELLQNELNRCERFSHTFAVSILDIDYFKKINDTYGHQMGDKVLIEIAGILKTHIRKTDSVGRFGGEEFVIICPESDKNGTFELMENIRKSIADYDFQGIKNVTASFGISLLRENDTVTSLLNRADKALYQAKTTGRNKVIMNED